MTLWNECHGADSAVVPSEVVFQALTLADSVSCFTRVNRSVLAFDVPVRWQVEHE
jgi:hypothetical protein